MQQQTEKVMYTYYRVWTINIKTCKFLANKKAYLVPCWNIIYFAH